MAVRVIGPYMAWFHFVVTKAAGSKSGISWRVRFRRSGTYKSLIAAGQS